MSLCVIKEMRLLFESFSLVCTTIDCLNGSGCHGKDENKLISRARTHTNAYVHQNNNRLTPMLDALSAPYGRPVYDMLCRVAIRYPQALYYHLRSFIIDLRERYVVVFVRALSFHASDRL